MLVHTLAIIASLLTAPPASTPPTDSTLEREDFPALVDQLGLSNYQPQILAAVSPTIRLTPTRVDSESLVAVGDSKFGGDPDLAPGVEWPQYMEWPLDFIAQLRLDDLPRDRFTDWPLPESGVLSFWMYSRGDAFGRKPEDRGSFVVTYQQDVSTLKRTPFPVYAQAHGLNREPRVYAPCSVLASAAWTVDHAAIDKRGMSDAEYDSTSTFEAMINADQGPTDHHLLGEPTSFMKDWEFLCQTASNGLDMRHGAPEPSQDRLDQLRPGVQDWRLLFQIGPDEAPGWTWRYGSKIFYWIRTPDLEARDFTQIWGIVER